MKNRFNIVFLEPNYRQSERPGFDEFMEPLNLCYLAAAAKEDGHSVFIKQQFEESDAEIIDTIIRRNPDVLAITVITLFFNRAVSIAKKIKERYPSIITIAGGAHISGDPKGSAEYFDYVVTGEGEIPFLRLLNELVIGNKPNLPGVGYYERDEFNYERKNVRMHNFRGLPFRDDLDFSKYTGMGNGPPPVPRVGFASMLLSRGCRFRCDFCVNSTIWNETSTNTIPVIKRTPSEVIREMGILNEDFDVGYVWFQDADFPIYDREYMNLFFEKKSEIGSIKYSFMTRIENIVLRHNVDEAKKFLSMLKSSGCHMIGFGLESFDTDLLRQINKKVSYETVKLTLELVFNAGIIPVAFFIIGYPDDTEARLKLTYSMAKNLKILRYRFSLFYPFVGTESHRTIQDDEWVISKDESYDYADNENVVVKCKIEKERLMKYFHFMNESIYFESEYKDNLKRFISMHPDMDSTIENWLDYINDNYKVHYV